MKNSILIGLITIVCIVCLLYILYLYVKDNDDILVVCNVGQGSSMLVKSQQKTVLIDVGPSLFGVTSCLDNYKYYKKREIDVVIISHPDYDHYGGLIRLVDLYSIKKIFVNRQMLRNYAYLNFDMESIDKGDKLVVGNYEITVLAPDENRCLYLNDKNRCSLVFEVCRFNVCGLNSGDYPMEDFKMISRDLLSKIDWFVVPHHGSGDSWSDELLDWMSSLDVAYVSVGVGNSYGHPNHSVLESFSKRGIRLRRTDQDGDLVIEY